MNIAVLGNGTIGSTLATAFTAAGHHVRQGTRAPGTVSAALRDADVVVLAVPGRAVADVVSTHGADLAGRLVVDATNNMGGAGPRHAHDAVVAAAPGVRYARAFNSLGVENFRDPRFGADTASLLYSSAAADRDLVEALIRAVGLVPQWLGEGTHDALDGLLPVWFALAQQHGRHVAFKVLTDD